VNYEVIINGPLENRLILFITKKKSEEKVQLGGRRYAEANRPHS